MISLAGRTALVTGGSRGIGRATVLLLARAGADVAFTFHTRSAEADAVAGEIRALGRRTATFGGDLADPAVVAAMADGVRRTFGRLDCFVANAGIWPSEEVPLSELAPGRWRATMAANLDAVYLTTKAALGLMSPGGRVVIVSSTAGQRGEAYHSDYAATKGAVIGSPSRSRSSVRRASSSTVSPPVGWIRTCVHLRSRATGGRASRRRFPSVGSRRRKTSQVRFSSSAAIWLGT